MTHGQPFEVSIKFICTTSAGRQLGGTTRSFGAYVARAVIEMKRHLPYLGGWAPSAGDGWRCMWGAPPAATAQQRASGAGLLLVGCPNLEQGLHGGPASNGGGVSSAYGEPWVPPTSSTSLARLDPSPCLRSRLYMVHPTTTYVSLPYAGQNRRKNPRAAGGNGTSRAGR
jgi:hypothetical protein